jgi:anti-sigma B factor antagonist
MAIRRRQVQGVVVVDVRGSLFGDSETEELQKAVTDEAAGNTRLILNLTQCQALNSIAIGVLMRCFASVRGRGGEIKLCGLGKRIKDLFTMTKLIMVFDHHETEEQALASFAVGAEEKKS